MKPQTSYIIGNETGFYCKLKNKSLDESALSLDSKGFFNSMAYNYLTKKIYGEKLLDPRWQKKRLEVLKDNEFTCQYCGDKENTLHVHHLSYNINGNPWDVPQYALMCLCENCHKVEHLSNLTALEKEILNHFLLDAIIYNGENDLFNKIIRPFIQLILNHKG